MLCVGFACFWTGVIVPVACLSASGGLTGVNAGGTVWSIIGGALAALGGGIVLYYKPS